MSRNALLNTFAGLVLVLSIVAMSFASRIVMVRNSWQQKIAKAKKDVLDKRKQATDIERQVTAAKAELQGATHGWERYWSSVTVERGRQPGSISPGIGTTLGLAEGVVVYVFQPGAAAAEANYVGPFKVTAAQDAVSSLAPNWRLRPGEDADWRYGANWRIRSKIPPQHIANLSTQERNLLLKDEKLKDQLEHLKLQNENKDSADEHLQKRLKELNGGSEFPMNVKKESLDHYLVEGYHKAVAEIEEVRDAVQKEVDQLRRDLKQTRDRINQLTTDNERLAKQLGDTPKTALKP